MSEPIIIGMGLLMPTGTEADCHTPRGFLIFVSRRWRCPPDYRVMRGVPTPGYG